MFSPADFFLEKVFTKIMQFDYKYEMSDDNQVYQKNSEREKRIVQITQNFPLPVKEKLFAACKKQYNYWHPNSVFDDSNNSIAQNKIITLCGFSSKSFYNLNDLPQEYIERFIEKTFDRLTDSGHLYLLDGPMEDHPKYDWVCEVAEEDFKEKYGKTGFIDNGMQSV